MFLLFVIAFMLFSSALGYYFGGKQGALGTFFTILFLFGLPAFIYILQNQ